MSFNPLNLFRVFNLPDQTHFSLSWGKEIHVYAFLKVKLILFWAFYDKTQQNQMKFQHIWNQK